MRFIFWLLSLLLLQACFDASKREGSVLARVHNEYLYESDMTLKIPPGTSPTDSIALVRNYVNNWVMEKLVLRKAERNLKDEDKKFENQLRDYRNSLLIFQYESRLVEQRLDTVIPDEEAEAYYNQNIGNFQLKNNIVKVYYARFEKADPNLAKIRRFFYADIPEGRDSLEVYIEKYSDLYFLNDEVWVLFDDVLRLIPIITYNKEAYLQNHRKIDVVEDDYIYFVCFTDFMIKDGVSPLSFEQEKIRQILINQRRLNIIRDMRQEVFQTATEKNEFDIF
ncbi:MAG: hypothetical protein ACNA7V_08940 [Bacteroidales bacterium]